ncbi:hypothetical protein [Bacteroides sp. 51]|uniref:hypothetical protein n=1 Tax=Bacteroides sp. 51 TaxID=2302938 RepID=UPI0013CF90B5|nr:hypothetical protein [Bacteroides sp. 51]NDV81485.1 hypothetical protein [Bacteroides sp. 51]
MDNRYSEEEKEELQENMLNEPSPVYKKSYSLADRPIPEYVLEDFRIGMEQYERGEFLEMEEFLEKLKQRNR